MRRRREDRGAAKDRSPRPALGAVSRPPTRAPNPARQRDHPRQRHRRREHKDTGRAVPSRRRPYPPSGQRGYRAAPGDPQANGPPPRRSMPRGWHGIPGTDRPAGPALGQPPGRFATTPSCSLWPGVQRTGGGAPATRATASSATGSRTQRSARANNPQTAASLGQVRVPLKKQMGYEQWMRGWKKLPHELG